MGKGWSNNEQCKSLPRCSAISLLMGHSGNSTRLDDKMLAKFFNHKEIDWTVFWKEIFQDFDGALGKENMSKWSGSRVDLESSKETWLGVWTARAAHWLKGLKSSTELNWLLFGSWICFSELPCMVKVPTEHNHGWLQLWFIPRQLKTFKTFKSHNNRKANQTLTIELHVNHRKEKELVPRVTPIDKTSINYQKRATSPASANGSTHK